jgi:hypothetical protein
MSCHANSPEAQRLYPCKRTLKCLSGAAEMSRELPHPSPAGAAVRHPTTDTKAHDRRGAHGPESDLTVQMGATDEAFSFGRRAYCLLRATRAGTDSRPSAISTARQRRGQPTRLAVRHRACFCHGKRLRHLKRLKAKAPNVRGFRLLSFGRLCFQLVRWQPLKYAVFRNLARY